MHPWQPVSQGLRWLRAGTLMTLVSTSLLVLLGGSLLGRIIHPVHYLITIGFFVALAGTARVALSSPASMGGKRLLGLALGAQIGDYALTKLAPHYYGQSFFSVAALCHHAEQALAVVGFFALMLGLRSLATHVGRGDLGLAFVGLTVVAVASWMLFWLVGNFNLRILWDNLYAMLACLGGYVFVYTLVLKKLAGAVDEFASK